MKKLNGLIQLCGISTTALTLQFLKLYKNLTYHGRQLLETLEIEAMGMPLVAEVGRTGDILLCTTLSCPLFALLIMK